MSGDKHNASSAAPSADVTRLLAEWGGGDREALDRLIPLVYDELRRLADRYLRRERADHTLQPTALVNEAYMRLVGQSEVRWQNRAHFIGVAAQLMRRILVDHARGRVASKRGGGRQKLSLQALDSFFEEPDLDLVALDDALGELAEMDPQQSRIVELRFFGGLTIEETAEVVGVSPMTVKREWALAKAWLLRQVSRE